jgi:ribose transport system substrate-binding protein
LSGQARVGALPFERRSIENAAQSTVVHRADANAIGLRILRYGLPSALYSGVLSLLLFVLLNRFIGEKAKRASIPIVTFDRVLVVPEDLVAAHIGSDNIEMGRVVVRYMARKLDGKGIVIQIEGTPGASATVDRKKGFEEEIAKYPGIKIAASFVGHYRRHDALQVMEDAITANPKIDAVYCHNEEMAFGALQALEARGRAKGVIVTGMDGLQPAMQSINEGKLTGTVYYHHMFPEALELAMKVLKGEQVPKVTMVETPFVTKENVAKYLAK